MILPPELMETYEKRKNNYNQTASKAEQIALTQFIRDGHLASQVRKSRKIHLAKAEKLADSAKKILGKDVDVQVGAAGFMVQLTFAEDCDVEKIAEKATAASRTTGAAQSGKSSQGAAQKSSGSQIATGEDGRQIRKGGDSQIPAGPNSGSEDKTGQSRKGAAGQDRKDSGGQSATRQDRCEKEKVINSSAQPAVRLLKSEGGLLFPAVVRNIHNR